MFRRAHPDRDGVGLHHVDLERDAPVVQFFEQVFEWEYVTYLFYHSMWARKCKWPELISEDSGDPLFDKFLTSGAARVQAQVHCDQLAEPIRHEEATTIVAPE